MRERKMDQDNQSEYYQHRLSADILLSSSYLSFVPATKGNTMTAQQLLQQRLANQQLNNPSFQSPPQLVHWCAAIQAQDYEMSKWAVGMRLPQATSEDIEHCIATGQLVRTHVLRPTWHLVHPADVRWMLTLTGPAIERLMGTYNRKLELDDKVFRKSNKIFEKLLAGGKQLKRTELAAALDAARIPTNDLRMNFLLIKAELDMIICNGGKKDKQITYALFEERVPPAAGKKREEALAMLALRYFNSHGPATLKDFTGWSGLTITAAREGLQSVKAQLAHDTFGGLDYYGPLHSQEITGKRNEVLLLPNYDEYLVAYKDREVILSANNARQLNRDGNPLFSNVILVNGAIAGTWKRTIKKTDIIMEYTPFTPLSKTIQGGLDKEAMRFKQFTTLK
ncbi:winged helix DNA-binding domain-containing protein [Chitinophaga agri]|uniref:Winged helix DNA-binding domain-containing protein n=1 Tax=Chitinophaga agri TaxID=2703787 RepID=A0A6B9ZNL2_9BACT|nr:winged helix DNA-binding domain-containing protein [Chitinophaga agri]QHS63878.1 winged helix DNA-binding domain-containing protein [Chitinophaga agri]